LVYSTYFGGTTFENGDGIAVDASGNAFITGNTQSNNFPTTAGAYQLVLKGAGDAFVSKLNAAGTGLIYSTYLGGVNDEWGQSIAIDPSGCAYAVGNVNNVGFPTTAGAFQPVYAGGGWDNFLVKLNVDGTGLAYATYLGGAGIDSNPRIAVDSGGYSYVTGQTSSNNFPTTAGAYQVMFGGGLDAYVTKFNTTGSALIYSTFLGKAVGDIGKGIKVDSSGCALVVGSTASNNFSVTSDAYQSIYGGGTDGFVTKFNSLGSDLVYSSYLGGAGSDVALDVALDSLNNAYVSGQTYSAVFPATPGAYQTMYSAAGDAFVSKFRFFADPVSVSNPVALDYNRINRVTLNLPQAKMRPPESVFDDWVSLRRSSDIDPAGYFQVYLLHLTELYNNHLMQQK
jgi:hypothetical protein